MALLLTIVACDRDEVSLVNDNISPETKEMVNRSIEIRRSIEEGRILRSSSVEDRNSITNAITEFSQAIMALEKDPNNAEELKKIARLYKTLASDEIQILEQDRDTLDSFIDEVLQLYIKYSDIQQTPIVIGNDNEEDPITPPEQEEDPVTWSLFLDNFTDKDVDENDVSILANFSMAYSQKGTGWGTGTNTISPTNGDHVYVTQGSGGSWLMTTCDLTNVKLPTFQIAHLFMINKGNNALFSRPQEIIRDAFLVYASTEYAGGNPGNPRGSDIWTNLNIAEYGGMPSGVDFHRSISPEISLAPYAGKQVTLGFYFDFDPKKHEFHFIRWQIDFFELFGQTSEQVVCTKPEIAFSDYVEPVDTSIIFSQNFGEGMGDFKQVTLEGDPILFETSEHNGSKFVVASGFPTKSSGTQLFYSPEIDLGGTNKPALSVNQTGRFYPKEAQELNLIEILVAEVVAGKTVEQLSWEPLTFKETLTWENWTPVQTEYLELPEKFNNKKVHIGFKYKSVFDEENNGFAPTWQLNKMSLKDLVE